MNIPTVEPSAVREAREARAELSTTVAEMIKSGMCLSAVSRALGKSHFLIRRIMDEHGIEYVTPAPAPIIEKASDPDKRKITVHNVSLSSTSVSVMEVSLPRLPWTDEYRPDPRRETAPRGSHMFTSAPGPYERFVAVLREVAA